MAVMKAWPLVPGAAAGVDHRTHRQSGNNCAFARNLYKPSPDRGPAAPFSGLRRRASGTSYEAEARRQNTVKDALKRIGHIDLSPNRFSPRRSNVTATAQYPVGERQPTENRLLRLATTAFRIAVVHAAAEEFDAVLKCSPGGCETGVSVYDEETKQGLFAISTCAGAAKLAKSWFAPSSAGIVCPFRQLTRELAEKVTA